MSEENEGHSVAVSAGTSYTIDGSYVTVGDPSPLAENFVPSHKTSPRHIKVVKRGGNATQDFQITKISNCIEAAFRQVGKSDTSLLNKLVELVEFKVNLLQLEEIPVEKIQDFIETALMEAGATDVAKAYIIYRSKHKELRESRLKPDPFAISNYIHPGRYARYIPEKKRREVYEETVGRVETMYTDRFPHLESEIKEAFDLVRQKRLLPSMRSMQFAGKAADAANARLYNCSALLIDKIRAFSDVFYLLLCGCGVGYSVQFDHVEKLPQLGYIDSNHVKHHTVADSIEGWANALLFLFNGYLKGYYPEFNYSKIRPAGAPLKTSGGKAPGHLGLKKSLELIRAKLDKAQGRQLRPIECYDIVCHVADAVLSGGIRRSATLCLFSVDDGEMIAAKTGNWYETHPWRQNSNNSVAFKRDDVTKKQYKRIFKSIKEFGEPGFVFIDDYNYLTNPCAEIGLNPVLEITQEVMELIEAKRAIGQHIPNAKLGDTFTGVSFCNLCEINAAAFKTENDFYYAAKMAARIGTLQTAFTSFPYLGWVTEIIVEREALLGVSMTGVLDAPDVALNPQYQQQAAEIAVKENKRVASLLGIRSAARVTTLKPAGTTSLVLGGVGSGIHPRHSRRYIRRVTANALEPVFQYFKSINPHMVVKKPNGDFVIEFVVESPESAIIQGDFSAVEFLEKVKSTQMNWVKAGTARPESSPGLDHNVSNTVVVRPNEWDEVVEYVWKHKDVFSGISFIPETGDKDYAYAPHESIVTEADEDKWNQILRYYTPVDYSLMVEEEDTTEQRQEVACAGGKCEI